MKTVPCLFFSLLFCSCTHAPSTDSPQQLRYAQVYARLLIAAERYKMSDSTVTPQTYGNAITALLEEYGTNEREVREFVKYLSDSPSQLYAFLDLVNSELERYRTKELKE
jgi:hypothetical protein